MWSHDLHDADEKGPTRVRASGGLIVDKLFGQELSYMISLPPAAAEVGDQDHGGGLGRFQLRVGF